MRTDQLQKAINSMQQRIEKQDAQIRQIKTDSDIALRIAIEGEYEPREE